MMRLVAGLLSLALAVQVHAAATEGRAQELTVSLDGKRESRYSRSAAPTKHASGAEQQKAHGAATKQSAVLARELRSLTQQMSIRADDFYIYEAVTSLRDDRDGDGYYREFRVRFDADTLLGEDILVYAKLYLRRVGEEDWFLYHETDDFWIEEQSDDDDYYVTTLLEAGYATAEYDVLIDLYETGYSGVVATFGPEDSAELAYLPLEELTLDTPVEIAGFWIDEVSTTLLIDEDDDGHFSQFRVTFDPDADIAGGLVYAVIWVRPPGGDWIEEFVTEDFVIGSGTSNDAYTFTADWVSGYPTSFYDVQIDLYEANTGLLAATAGSEWAALAQIPLEDQSRDGHINPPVGGGGGDSSSRERGGGGAMAWWWVAMLMGVAKLRRNREW